MTNNTNTAHVTPHMSDCCPACLAEQEAQQRADHDAEEDMAIAIERYRDAYDVRDISDADVRLAIVSGRLYCPHCGRYSCDASCAH